MGKKNKAEKEKHANGEESKTAGKAAKSPPKKTAPRKKPAPAKKPAVPASTGPSAYEPSDEEIRTRAYFIAERRMRLSLSGDSAHDWIEARRQLIDEGKSATS